VFNVILKYKIYGNNIVRCVGACCELKIFPLGGRILKKILFISKIKLASVREKHKAATFSDYGGNLKFFWG
jgi:hypothetical protein